MVMRIAMWLLLALACCGMVQATGGMPPQSPSDSSEGLFIPPAEDVWHHAENGVTRWQVSNQATSATNRKAATSPQNKTATKPAKADQIAEDDNATAEDSLQTWTLALIALGGLTAILVPAFLVGRRMFARHMRREADYLSYGLRPRPSVSRALAASLVQTQLRSNKTARKVEPEQPRRAA